MRAVAEGDGVIIAVERAAEVADRGPGCGCGDVGGELVNVVGDGLQGGRIRNEGQGVAGIAFGIAVDILLVWVGFGRAVVADV